MDDDQSAGDSDVLITGAGESRSRVPRLAWIAFCAAIVIALVAGIANSADRGSRHREFTTLLGATIDGQATAVHADELVESTRSYTMPLLGSAQPNVRAGLQQLIAQSATEGAKEVRASRAKAAELSYLDAWAAYLDSVAQGGDTGAIPTAALATKRTDASAALRNAAPDRIASLAIPSSL